MRLLREAPLKPDRGLLALLQLSDSGFPVGAFAHSDGLESLAADGLLQGAADLERVLTAHRRLSLDRGETRFVRAAHRATIARDDALLRQTAETEVAARPAAVQRFAILSVGAGLLRAAAAVATPEERDLVSAVREVLGEVAPRASVFGAVAAVLGADEAAAAEGHAYAVLSGMVAAAVRLGRVAPLEAQAAMRRALAAPGSPEPGDAEALGDWAVFSPLLDVAGMRHELLELRLFAS